MRVPSTSKVMRVEKEKTGSMIETKVRTEIRKPKIMPMVSVWF